ncbi:riboflavin synthase [Alphaproteobacteria bacterium]|nr:riboflavin synthase [Alphaproteobacteria bacterium]
MFTGIITDVGTVKKIEPRGDVRIEIETLYPTNEIDLGASIACAGPCLTVVEIGTGWFAVEASAETMSRTTLGGWKAGTKINLERALRVGDELGGHIVSGHVDGQAHILDMRSEGDSVRFDFEAPSDLKAYIAEKGSVSLDGVSLTVNEVGDTLFGVNIISHTRAHTTFVERVVGDMVNLEIDTLARYVGRLLENVE